MTVLEPDDFEKLQEWLVLSVVDPIPILKSARRRVTKRYEHHWHALVRITKPTLCLLCPS